MRLDRDQLVELADLVADALEERSLAPASQRLVDAGSLALALGVERDYVYAHADELGARRLGTGPRARLRFDPEEAARRLVSCQASRGSSAGESAPALPLRRRRRRPSGTDVELLPVRGAQTRLNGREGAA